MMKTSNLSLEEMDRRLDEIDVFLANADDSETLKRELLRREHQIRALQTRINLAIVELESNKSNQKVLNILKGLNKMNREYLIIKAKEIKENGNMLGIEVTIPNQNSTELIINSNSSIDNKVEYYCKAYDENLVHSMNDKIKIVNIEEVYEIETENGTRIKL